MNFILSIETSTKVCSVALHQNGEVVSCSQYHLEKSHSSILVPLIEETINHGGISKNELSAVAISEGPGSYTGLRIGTSTAKGLCFGLDIPLIAVGTLISMAYEVNQNNYTKALLCPMLDARRMEVYSLIVNQKLEVIEEVEPNIIDENSFNEILGSNKVLFFGDGSAKCREVIKHDNAIFIDGVTPSARNIGALAWSKFQNEDFADLAYFEPFYLKAFKAGKPKQLV